MTDEEIIAIRKKQVGRKGSLKTLEPYSDSIAFARAIIQAYEHSMWKPLSDWKGGDFLAYLPNEHPDDCIQMGSVFLTASGKLYDVGGVFIKAEDIALVREVPLPPGVE